MSVEASSPSIVIEFVGLPGTGKSTLSRRTAAVLARDHPRVAEPISRIGKRSGPYRILSKGRFAAEHAVRHPRAAIKGVRTILAIGQPTPGDFVRVCINYLYVAGVVTSARSTSGVTLLDQGPYQALWSIGLRSLNDWSDLFDRFDHLLTRTSPDLVVLVEADIETIENRLRSRERGHTRVAIGTQDFERGVDGYNRVKEYIRSSDRIDWIVVENETRADLEAGTNRIAEAIDSLAE